MKGTLIQFDAEGDYDDLIADLRRRLKAENIQAVVRRQPGRRALVEGLTAQDASTFMYLVCFDFRVVKTDMAGTRGDEET